MADLAKSLGAIAGVADQKTKTEQYKVLLQTLMQRSSIETAANLNSFIDHCELLLTDRMGLSDRMGMLGPVSLSF